MNPIEKPPRRRNPGWVELSVALAALIVSAVSLYIARQQTEVMHRQLAASIWPAVQFSTSNLLDGEPVITLSLENVGVGPAHIHHFGVSHEGRSVPDLTQFIEQCCNPEGTPFHTVTSFVEGRILPAGRTIDFLVLSAEPGQAEIYHRFDRIRGGLDLELCYCSVLDECWAVARGADRSQLVPSCVRPSNAVE